MRGCGQVLYLDSHLCPHPSAAATVYGGNTGAKIKITNVQRPLIELMTAAPRGTHNIIAGTDAEVRLVGF